MLTHAPMTTDADDNANDCTLQQLAERIARSDRLRAATLALAQRVEMLDALERAGYDCGQLNPTRVRAGRGCIRLSTWRVHMSASEIIGQILRNPAFWAALLALFNVVLDYFVPTFPSEIKAAINALLTVIFAAITGTQTVRAVRAQRAAKARGNVIGGSGNSKP